MSGGLGRVGEICRQYLHKGSLAVLESSLQTDKYEDKGRTKYYTKVVALSMQMLDRKRRTKMSSND